MNFSQKIKLFSRNHHDLFDIDPDKSIIIQKSNALAVYQNVVLKVTIGNDNACSAGQLIFEAVVDWQVCHIQLFLTREDRLNCIASYNGTFKILIEDASSSSIQESEEPELFKSLLMESFFMLKRGHSVLDPLCTCSLYPSFLADIKHISMRRKMQLGYNNFAHCSVERETQASSYCKAPSNRHMQSVGSIACELGILNIQNAKIQLMKSAMHAAPLLESLIHFGQYSVKHIASVGNPKETFLSSILCCIPEQIASVQDIIQSVKILHPEPFLWTLSKCTSSTKYLLEQQILNEIVTQQSPMPFYFVKHFGEKPCAISNNSVAVLSLKKRKYNDAPQPSSIKKQQELECIRAISFYLKTDDAASIRVDEDIKMRWKNLNLRKIGLSSFQSILK